MARRRKSALEQAGEDEQAEVPAVNKHSTHSSRYDAGPVDEVANRIAIITDKDYRHALTPYPNRVAYIMPLNIADANVGELTFKNGILSEEDGWAPDDSHYYKEGLASLDIITLHMLYSIILNSIQSKITSRDDALYAFDILESCDITKPVTLYLPDYFRMVGPKPNPGKNYAAALLNTMNAFKSAVGVHTSVESGITQTTHYALMLDLSYDEKKNTISFVSPYLAHIAKTVLKKNIRYNGNKPLLKSDGQLNLGACHSYAIKPALAGKSLNRRAAEIMIYLVRLIETTGTRKGSAPHALAGTIIDECPEFKYALAQESDRIAKNNMLRSVFKKVWEILPDKTYSDIPTKHGTLEIVTKIRSNDSEKGYQQTENNIPTSTKLDRTLFEFWRHKEPAAVTTTAKETAASETIPDEPESDTVVAAAAVTTAPTSVTTNPADAENRSDSDTFTSTETNTDDEAPASESGIDTRHSAYKPAPDLFIETKRLRIASFGKYMSSGSGFAGDVEAFQVDSDKSGYSNLDAAQQFYPGFYVIGANPSLGKTTFVYQMAEQMAVEYGRSILYFSTEMSQFELFSKSISRAFHKTYLKMKQEGGRRIQYPCPSSADIRNGKAMREYPDEYRKHFDECVKSIGDRITVVNTGFKITVESIIKIIDDYIAQTGNKPTVIIDYLQVIAPSSPNGKTLDSKASIDHIVETLKGAQMDKKLTLIVVSSLNRMSYYSYISMDSFKESGGIEYTSDVLWGLQYRFITEAEESTDNNSEKKNKKKALAALSNKEVRPIDLICLKNRFGKQSYTLKFDYYAANDHFVPKEES